MAETIRQLLEFAGPIREGTAVAIVLVLAAMFLTAYVRYVREK